MGGRNGESKSFNTIGKDGFARTATVIRPGKAIGLRGDNPLKLVGHQKGDFMISPDNSTDFGLRITHVPTGMQLTRVDNLQQGKHVVDAVQHLSSKMSESAAHQMATPKQQRAMSITKAEKEKLGDTVTAAIREARSKYPSKAKYVSGDTRGLRQGRARKAERQIEI